MDFPSVYKSPEDNRKDGVRDSPAASAISVLKSDIFFRKVGKSPDNKWIFIMYIKAQRIIVKTE